MSRADRIALLFSLLAVIAVAQIAERVFERMAHLEDEYAYVWQAQVIASGKLTLPSPPHHKSFLVPFVVDHNGQRFGKYPLGWPVVLSFGERVGALYLVNPILAGLGVWLTYRLGKKVFGETVGLLASGLTLTSPFFLINSGTLLSHPWGLVLSTAFAISWLDTVDGRIVWQFPTGKAPPWVNRFLEWVPALTAGLTLGVLALSRPLTMVGIAVPFGIHGIILLVRGGKTIRQRILLLGLIAILLSGFHFVWQYALTGDPLLNPYTLWWEYDKLGFGPGFGVTKQGHNLDIAWINTEFSLKVGSSDLFGWWTLSWIFLPFGLWSIRKRKTPWLLVSVFPVLVIIYLAYWVGAWLFGPRYFYEGLFSLTLLSAAGIAWLAGWPLKPDQNWRRYTGQREIQPLAITALLALLVTFNLLFYTPMRLQGLHGMYNIDRSRLEPFLTPEAQSLTPALIIVDAPRWMPYGALLELETPFLDTPFIFAFNRTLKEDALLIADFPERKAFYYYPEEPYRFYSGPRP